MGKSQTAPRLSSTHHDLQDIIVNVLATDQVERFAPASEERKSSVPAPKSPPQQAIVSKPKISPVNERGQALRKMAQEPLYAEPLHETVDHVRVQVQRMYVHRQRLGFWLRATLSVVLLSVLGFVFYYWMSNSPTVELSNFF